MKSFERYLDLLSLSPPTQAHVQVDTSEEDSLLALLTALVFVVQDLSPLILLASCMSFGMMVTLLAWMAQRLVSSNNPTK